MADIFISYSKTSRAHAEQLADDLRHKGFTVWYDTGLVAGDSFREVITSELAQARAAIVIWTPESVKSDWVCSEASRARARRISFRCASTVCAPTTFHRHSTACIPSSCRTVRASRRRWR